MAGLQSAPREARFGRLSSLILALHDLHQSPAARKRRPRLPGLEAAVCDLESAGAIDFFNTLLPSIATAALRLPEYPATLPLLPSGAAFAEVSIPRDFGYVLLANTFLGNHQPPSAYPEFSGPDSETWGDTSWALVMSGAVATGIERIKCQLAYFQTVAGLPALNGSIVISLARLRPAKPRSLRR
jgi:hypothetical protein